MSKKQQRKQTNRKKNNVQLSLLDFVSGKKSF